MTDQLTLRYDPLTIKHLGVSLYSQLPSVFSEMISNAFDADAENISIDLFDDGNDKSIRIADDGHGMSFDEINQKYLLVGRNRRKDVETKLSPIKKRPVIGKKGLGKLSVFGICTEITVRTVNDGFSNKFKMSLTEIERLQGEYHPEILEHNKPTQEASGTEILLENIKRKSPFDIQHLARSVAKKFTVFDEIHTKISLNDEPPTLLTNEMKFFDLDVEFEWTFPNIKIGDSYQYSKKIAGKILTPRTPVKDTSMKGFYLVSRGKVVNESEFYGARDNDLVHSYMTGYITVDFIDDFEEDIISTDRHSLIWADDRATELRSYLQSVVRQIGIEWKSKRASAKQAEITEHSGMNLSDWKDSLPSHERILADKILNPVLENPSLDLEKSTKIINGVISQFENATFKNYASTLADTVVSEELPKVIELLNDWKITESKELSALATARIEVIQKFEELLEDDTKEVPTLHDFLKKFSWLLDPRVLEFQDEVTYSKLLKENYPEEELEEKNKRIDFLCSNILGGILYVIEIKRSRYKVDKKAIDQAYEYGVFLKERYASDSGFSNVVCYVVGGEKSTESIFRAKEKTYMQSGEVFVKTYRELLEQSKVFHREFIETHKKFNKLGAS